jgi:asparagine synthase (glutamine-hydrolysing)
MPGIFGFHKPNDPSSGAALLEKMGRALEPEARFKLDVYTESDLGLGRASLGIVNAQPQPLWNQAGDICIVMEGELYDTQALKKQLVDKGYAFTANNDPELVLHLYEEHGDGFAACLNGAFAIAIWDRRSRLLLLANDRLGLYPIYYHQRPGVFTFASGVRALLVESELPRSVDQLAIAEFLTYDHILGQRTLLKEAHLLPQASLLKVRNGQLALTRYWTLKYADQYPFRKEEEYSEQLLFHLRQAVRRQAGSDQPTGLLLSGGLDSRFILGLLAENNDGRGLHTFTWSIPGSDDARYAQELAKLAGADHHFFELKPTWLLEKHEKCTRLTDGMGNLVNLHAIAALEQETAFAKVLFKGFLGDAMFGFGLRPRFWADYSPEDSIKVHMEAYRDYRVLTFDLHEHSEVFSSAFQQEIGGGVLQDYRAGILAAKSSQLADQRLYFDLTQRVPRMTLNGVEVVRDQAMARLPFADNDLVEFTQTMPPWMKFERVLFNNVFIQAFPRLARVPNTHTGLPMISDARELSMRFQQMIRWHMRNRGLGKWIGPDRRPYKDYNAWFRGVLRSWMEDTLLSRTSLERGYYQPGFLQKLVQKQLAGENHAVRIGALMAIELWHQRYID